MNIMIKPGAALDDATEIDSIVKTIRESLEELNNVITSVIPSDIQTTWSEEVLNNWKNYYGNDIPNALSEMEMSALNLRLAVEKAVEYSNAQ